MTADLHEQMRAEWNARAHEDANYYVAFARREQDDEAFLATAADVVRDLEADVKRLPPDVTASARRALEIGCGPGRLMRPMSRHFGEIHGVDVSDEMIRRARAKLSDLPQAHVHHTSGSDLSLFPDNYFDFIFSFAVFQHIPSRDVVFNYLSEACRVLKPGGIFRCQLNGLPPSAERLNTWDGVRIGSAEIARFARDHGFLLLALDGVETQYMWTTWRKPAAPPGPTGLAECRVRTICNADTRLNSSKIYSGAQAVPAAGRFACAALLMESLPQSCDINSLDVRIDGAPATVCYVGTPPDAQINVRMPRKVRTGLLPVEIFWKGERLCPTAWMRVVPAGPQVPRLCSVSDGTNLLSGPRIERRIVKLVLEEVAVIESFQARVDELPVREPEFFCIDPLDQRYEVNFPLPETIGPGSHQLQIQVADRKFAPVPIEVV